MENSFLHSFQYCGAAIKFRSKTEHDLLPYYGHYTVSFIVYVLVYWMWTDMPNARREERIIITPNPASANADDDVGFRTQILNFSDGKSFNPTTGNDE